MSQQDIRWQQRFSNYTNAVQKIRDVFGRYPQVEKATLYGSRAKGNHKSGSDIDLTLHGARI